MATKSDLTELRPIALAEVPVLDVIFIHGLDGDIKETWAFDQPHGSWLTWLTSAYPGVNIWSLGYRVRSSWWRGGSMKIQDRAVNILATIQGELLGNIPIVFVCHSYGGLLVKQVFATGLGRGHSEYKTVLDRVRGAVFLGTPHNGSRIADYINSLSIVLRSSSAIRELKYNSAHLRDLDGFFREHASNLKLRAFYETFNTHGVRVVDENSADPHIRGVTPIGVDTDHIELSKPSSRDVRVTQTNALIGEVIEALAENTTSEGPTPLGRLLAAQSQQEYEHERRRLELELQLNPANQKLREALTLYRQSPDELPASTERAAEARVKRRNNIIGATLVVLAATFNVAVAAFLIALTEKLIRALATMFGN